MPPSRLSRCDDEPADHRLQRGAGRRQHVDALMSSTAAAGCAPCVAVRRRRPARDTRSCRRDTRRRPHAGWCRHHRRRCGLPPHRRWRPGCRSCCHRRTRPIAAAAATPAVAAATRAASAWRRSISASWRPSSRCWATSAATTASSCERFDSISRRRSTSASASTWSCRSSVLLAIDGLLGGLEFVAACRAAAPAPRRSRRAWSRPIRQPPTRVRRRAAVRSGRGDR